MVAPGESFILRMDPPRMGSTLKIEMRHLEQVVKKWELTPGIRDIKIQVPVGDGKGYYFYIQEFDRNNQLIARSSKAIDASSDWTKFPRYGYVTRFDQDPKDARKTILKMAQQGVNIIQFYDWMNKHHAPLDRKPVERHRQPHRASRYDFGDDRRMSETRHQVYGIQPGIRSI